MKLIIYAGHPAQYLFFRNTIINLERKGHKIKLLIKSKDILEILVLNDSVDYTVTPSTGTISVASSPASPATGTSSATTITFTYFANGATGAQTITLTADDNEATGGGLVTLVADLFII